MKVRVGSELSEEIWGQIGVCQGSVFCISYIVSYYLLVFESRSLTT